MSAPSLSLSLPDVRRGTLGLSRRVLGRWQVRKPSPVSIRWRLTVWYSVVLAMTLAVFSLIIYWYMGSRLMRDIDRSSRERALQVEDILVRKYIQIPLASQLLTRLGLEESVDPFRDAGVGVRVYDARGMLVDGSDYILLDRTRLPDDRLFIREAMRVGSHRAVLRTAEGSFYVLTKTIYQHGYPWAVIQILTSMEPYKHTMDVLARLLAAGTILATALAFFTGAALARTALAPIDGITRTAQHIYRARDLSRRIEVEAPQDEVGRLKDTVNDMLARIESMFEQQSQFLADVSHELRTPLTTIRGEIELMKRQREIDPEGLAAMANEAERMSRMIGDLLLLARAQDDQIQLEQEPVELDTLVLDVYRQARRLASGEHRVKLGHEDAATVIGDRDRLRQLLLNLMINALTHSPAGTEVTLSLYRNEDMARLEVSDQGPGIPKEDLPHIFDRFYRVDKARSRSSGGTGLGLAIVRWVAAAHGGAVHVRSAAGTGTTFAVLLPLAPADRSGTRNGHGADGGETDRSGDAAARWISNRGTGEGQDR